MPLLGHAFVGAATAIATPRQRRWSSLATDLWLPAVVLVAYLPDIAAQVLITLGVEDGRAVTHTLLFAVVAGIVAGALPAVLMRIPLRIALAVSVFSTVAHVALDVAQGTDRQPWLPFSDHPLVLDWIPTDRRLEALLFAALFGLFLIGRYFIQARRTSADSMDDSPPENAHPVHSRRAGKWIGRGLLLLIVLAALGMDRLRDGRERQLRTAGRMLSEQNFDGALEMITAAERWPYVIPPGRADYLRAEAYNGRGERERAEQYYLAAARVDPDYFWLLADLSAFYVSGPGDTSQRLKLILPYLERLRQSHASNERLPWLVRRLRRKLALPEDARNTRAALDDLIRRARGASVRTGP